MKSQIKGIVMSWTIVTSILMVSTIFALVDDSNAEICGRIADVVFVLDTSGSMYRDYRYQLLKCVQQLVNEIDVGQGKTRIGALSFNSDTKSEFHLKTFDSKQDVMDAIADIHFTIPDFANTYEALSALRTEQFSERNGDRSDVPNIAILITDSDSIQKARTANEAKLTREAGVVIIAIGIANGITKKEVEDIASSPKSDYMYIFESFNGLQSDTFTNILMSKICKAKEQAYNEQKCSRIVDVVFVIDSSSSICLEYFHQQLEFVKQVVNALHVGQGKTRIGALSFSNRIIPEFSLNKYDSKQELLNAISAIHYSAGDSTNTFNALRVLRTEQFSERNGDRSDAPNIAVLLTDGESYNMASTINEAKLTRDAGVTIFAIGIGDSVKEEELEQLASSPKSDYMHIMKKFTELQSGEFAKLLINKACKV